MDEMMRTASLYFLLLIGFVAGCRSDSSVDPSSDASTTLEAVGRRLSGSMSESKLAAIATDGRALLEHLYSSEREALGRGELAFRAEVPVNVLVAVPSSSIPFWIGDQGFEDAGWTLDNDDTHWLVYRRAFPAGLVGLGVNGLDRTPPAHYVVFVTQASGPSALSLEQLVIEPRSRDRWSKVVAKPGVSAARDV